MFTDLIGFGEFKQVCGIPNGSDRMRISMKFSRILLDKSFVVKLLCKSSSVEIFEGRLNAIQFSSTHYAELKILIY